MEPAETLMARARGRAARVAGAQAGSMGVPIGLAGEICGRALRHGRPGRVDEGDGGGGVLELRQRIVEFDT
jgi:hypothetical protein